MKRILLSLLVLTCILSCRKSDPQNEIDPNSFFLRLKIDGLNFEVTEKEATAECFELTSHVEDSNRVVELDNVRMSGCPRLPFVRLGILLASAPSGNSYTIKTGLVNKNRMDLFINASSHYNASEISMLPAELVVTFTKNEQPGGYIEGTIKGTAVKVTQVPGAMQIYKTVPVDGTFRVLSK